MMEIGKKFNELTLKEYLHYIKNNDKYSDFNTLGLYRSLCENENLSLDEKIEIREFAHSYFKKSFDFLQIKDPMIFFEVSTIGEDLTKGDEQKFWDDIKHNQKKILSDKKIKHRNFGTYSKHECGDKECVWNGLMIRQGSWLSYGRMHLIGDKNKYQQKVKSDRVKSERKNMKNMINQDLENE